MNIQKLECPNCHAGLDNDYGNAGVFFCKYCGQKMIVEEIQNADYDLKIRKLEMEHETTKMAMEQKNQSMKYAHDKENAKLKHKQIIILLAFIVIMFVFLMVFSVVSTSSIGSPHRKRVKELNNVETQVQEAILAEDYDLALLKVNQLRLDDGYSKAETAAWDAKREDYIELINKKMDKK